MSLFTQRPHIHSFHELMHAVVPGNLTALYFARVLRGHLFLYTRYPCYIYYYAHLCCFVYTMTSMHVHSVRNPKFIIRCILIIDLVTDLSYHLLAYILTCVDRFHICPIARSHKEMLWHTHSFRLFLWCQMASLIFLQLHDHEKQTIWDMHLDNIIVDPRYTRGQLYRPIPLICVATPYASKVCS